MILALAPQGGLLASRAVEATGLARVTVSRRIQKLADLGYLQRHGGGTRPGYSLGVNRFWTARQARPEIEAHGGEFAVWERHLAPLLGGVPANVVSIANTAFTEMLNNAIDHSQAQQVLMGIHVARGRLQMAVMDDGVGVFRKIGKALGLFDDRLAILELAKGKYTTAPQAHSGMGVFVTSRMLDGFAVHSKGLTYAPRTPAGVDLGFAWTDVPPWLNGTVVLMDIALDATRKANDVYDRYFSPDEVGAEAFHTTEVPVRLAELSSELTSRSQGKWVIERASQFKTVLLDFDGVQTVGQAFVDEIFRVFALAHPEVTLKALHLDPRVRRNIQMFAPHFRLT